jgi:hypothetical protein
VKTGEQCQEKNKRNRLFFPIFPDAKNTAYRFMPPGKTPDEVVPGDTRGFASCRMSICGARWGKNFNPAHIFSQKNNSAAKCPAGHSHLVISLIFCFFP